MHRIRLALTCLLLGLTGVASAADGPPQAAGADLRTVDGVGRPVKEVEVGDTLFVAAQGLGPRRLYEFRLGLAGNAPASPAEAVSFARVATDAEGRIAPFALWYNTGIAGCSPRVAGGKLPPFTYRTFDEAERELQGKKLTVSVHPVAADPSGKAKPLDLRAGAPLQTREIPVAGRTHPLLFTSDEEGCWRNALRVGERDVYVSGVHFQPDEVVEVALAPHQAAWYARDDVIQDVTGEHQAAEAKRARADASGRFSVKAWPQARQRRGVYDLAVHRGGAAGPGPVRVGPSDIVFSPNEPGFILYETCERGGQVIDLAVRPTGVAPYRQATRSYAPRERVWAGLDPTLVPEKHPGARYAAFYVTEHRDVASWEQLGRDGNPLTDITGGVEIVPVKAGSLAATDVPVWDPPLRPGRYDLVVDFGADPGEAAAFRPQGRYDPGTCFLDGGWACGFLVAEDPFDLGPAPVGRAEYSRPRFLKADSLGDHGYDRDVDLRAVVRYPARAAGENTPVAAGKHPLFVIEHGNHEAGRGSYLGYMHLLDDLASHGIIAVSIDADDLARGDGYFIPERGDLILRHLEQWSHLNDPATFPDYPDFFGALFRGHVDLSRISVSGHSRGGEASVSAYLRNQNPAFVIRAVSSIAPVDVVGYRLAGVPYFVILPAADGDVADLSGLRIYDRAGGGAGEAVDRSGIYVYGASHNFFNTAWARDGDDSWPGRPDYIDKDDQQRIGEAYVAAFTRLHLNGESVYRDLLRGRLAFPSTAGFKIYNFCDERPETTLEDGRGRAAEADRPTRVLPLARDIPHFARPLEVQWPRAEAQLTYRVPRTAASGTAPEVLSFRVAQTNAPVNPAALGQDFQVVLEGAGKARATYAAGFGAIPVPYDRTGVDRHSPWPRTPRVYNVMTTVRIPLRSFVLNRPGLSLDHIDAIHFRFTDPSTGALYVDDIELTH